MNGHCSYKWFSISTKKKTLIFYLIWNKRPLILQQKILKIRLYIECLRCVLNCGPRLGPQATSHPQISSTKLFFFLLIFRYCILFTFCLFLVLVYVYKYFENAVASERTQTDQTKLYAMLITNRTMHEFPNTEIISGIIHSNENKRKQQQTGRREKQRNLKMQHMLIYHLWELFTLCFFFFLVSLIFDL